MRKASLWISAIAMMIGAAGAVPAQAGDSNGNMQVKLGVTGLIFDDKTTSTSANIAGLHAEVNDTILPTLMLNYYFSPNWSVELFCCFAQLNVHNKAGGKLASTWAFPPMLTAQYHFTNFGPVKPYVGAGVEWIHYFDESSNLPGSSVEFRDSWGVVLQAGVDYDLGNGFSLGLDAKKVWEKTKLTYDIPAYANHDLDPWVLTANVGYRFDLGSLLGRREVIPLK